MSNIGRTFGTIRGGGTPWNGSMGGRRDLIPADVQDEVELWARGRGRHARIVWSSVLGCAMVEIDCKPGDPRLEAYQQGRIKQEPKERVFLHRHEDGAWVGVPSRPGDLTPDHVRSWLERGDMWSGRGEVSARNLHEACVQADERNEKHREAMREAARQGARDRARDQRRQVLGLPVVAVPDTIKGTDQ